MADALSPPFSGGRVTNDRFSTLERALDVPFDFRRQPSPIPAEASPERRVALIVLMLGHSHGSAMSWKGLQVLSWMLRGDRNAALLYELMEGRDIPDRPAVRFEPALDRAVDLAIGYGLAALRSSGAMRLTDAGKRTLDALTANDVFVREKATLGRLRRRITQADINRILDSRRL